MNYMISLSDKQPAKLTNNRLRLEVCVELKCQNNNRRDVSYWLLPAQ